MARADDQEHFVNQDGRERRFLVHVPESLDRSRPSPVVLAFHDNKFAKPERLIGWLQNNAPLVRLKQGDDHNDRNLKIGSGAFMPFGGTQKMGVRNEDKIAVSIERDPRGFYKVTPSAPLAPGEYGFILATGFGAGSGKVYDFGVD